VQQVELDAGAVPPEAVRHLDLLVEIDEALQR
jgi:hypothetical protein